MQRKKIVVIGGGHNGLVAAAYLAKAGHQVTVLEAGHQVGGAASSDTTTFPGSTISTASYLNSLFLPEIVDDLELKKYGYEVIQRNPSSFTPLPDGRSLFLGPDMAFNQREIAKFSKRDAVRYPHYEKQLGEIADWTAQMMTMTPPNMPPRNMRDVKNLLTFARHALHLNPVQMFRLGKLLLSDPVNYLNEWFESDVLKATLLTDAMIGAVELNGYVLLHHVMGSAGGARGVWGYMRGGMGGISNALKRSCEALGVEIICCAKALNITVKGDHKVAGVAAQVVGERWKMPLRHFYGSDIVVAAVDPSITFQRLLEPSILGIARLRDRILVRDIKSASMKINCTLSGLPDFRAMPGTEPGPQHRGTIHISPSVQYILDALNVYRKGLHHLSSPILEITLPSVLDDTLAPEGCHVMNIFVQFYPYVYSHERLYIGSQLPSEEIYFRDVVMPLLREYVSNIDTIITGTQVLTPLHLEQMFGMQGGNIFHGGMGLGQLFSLRPTRGVADYRVREVEGLYLSGAGTHPGGGVTGACGYNAAREILRDIGS